MTPVANVELAQDFYSALGRADAARMLELLHDDFSRPPVAATPRPRWISL